MPSEESTKKTQDTRPEIEVIAERDVSDERKEFLNAFRLFCFDKADDSLRRANHYFSQSCIRIVAKGSEGNLIGYLRLIKRHAEYLGEKILIGGIGDVAVHPLYRRQGVATQLLKKGMEILEREKCDVSLLFTDLEEKGGLYERVGFIPWRKPYRYHDKDGNVCTVDKDETMLAPLCSHEVFERLLHKDDILEVGKGNW